MSKQRRRICWCCLAGRSVQLLWAVWGWLRFYVYKAVDSLLTMLSGLGLWVALVSLIVWCWQLGVQLVHWLSASSMNFWDWSHLWLWRALSLGVLLPIGVELVLISLRFLFRFDFDLLTTDSHGLCWVCPWCQALLFQGWRVGGRLSAPSNMSQKVGFSPSKVLFVEDCEAESKPPVENTFGGLNEPFVWIEFTRRVRLFLYVSALLYIDAVLFRTFGLGREVPRFSMAWAWLRSPEQLCSVVHRGLARTSLPYEQINPRVKILESSWVSWWDRTLRLCAMKSLSLGDALRLLFLRDFQQKYAG